MKYFSILWAMKNDVRLKFIPWKNLWFCFIFIVWVHFSHKTEKCWFWKSLKYFNIFMIKRDVVSDLNISHGKMSYFVSSLFFGFTLIIKLRYFNFESHWNTFMIFIIKKIWSQIWICPMKKCLILFHFHCLGSL